MFCVKIPCKPDTPISRYQHLCLDSRFASIWSIFGVVGMLKLVARSYLIVIAERDCVGTYWGHPIYKVSSLKVFPCDHSLKKGGERVFSAVKCCGADLRSLFLIRYQFDAEAEPRFLWNNYMLEVAIDNKVKFPSFHQFQTAIGRNIVHPSNLSLGYSMPCLSLGQSYMYASLAAAKPDYSHTPAIQRHTTSDLVFWFDSMNKYKRARSSVDQPLVDVWLRELGHLSTRNFALRRATSQDLVLRLDVYKKLDKHRGCVNTLTHNNVFQAKIMPYTNDCSIVTFATDG
ncbi:hypothetical protein Q3G72_015439 [Acer saccharum]|nr:hypothetical protein Q3G72_015439 [Acer saccharum]